MYDFVEQLKDRHNDDINRMAQLVINTVHAKALYQKGGWKLVGEHYDKDQDECLNPNFTMTYLSIARAKSLEGVKTSARRSLDEIVSVVNEKLGYEVVENLGDRIRMTI